MSSNADPDRLIDAVVRQMLDADAPEDFRGRVEARLAAAKPHRSSAWIAAPVAAAAVVVLALWTVSGPRPSPHPPVMTVRGSDVALPAAAIEPIGKPVERVTSVAPPPRRHPRSVLARGVGAPGNALPVVAAPAGPAALEIIPLEVERPAAMSAVRVAAISIPELQITPIPDQPLARH